MKTEEAIKRELGEAIKKAIAEAIREVLAERGVKAARGEGKRVIDQTLAESLAVLESMGTKEKAVTPMSQDLSESLLRLAAGRVKSAIVADALYSPEEVAEMLGLNIRTVYKWISQQSLKAVKPGGKRFFVRGADLLALSE